MAWEQEGPWPLQFFRNRWIFGNHNVSSENFRTFAVGKDKGPKFYWKVFEVAPLLYMCLDAPAQGSKKTITESSFLTQDEIGVLLCYLLFHFLKQEN